MQRSDTY